MSWITGSATDRFDLLTKLINSAIGNGVTSVAIQSGTATTGAYVVGDVLTVSGGTAYFAAKLRVTAVSGGNITGVVVHEGGSYSVNPTNPVSVTGGGGTGATFNLTMASNGWTEKRRSKEAASATVGSGGSGGTNGTQTVTLSTVGAVGVTTSAQFSVTVSGGAITAVLGVVTAGLYEKPPTNPVAVTGAGLSGATLNVTYVSPTAQEQVAILQGTGGGSDQILVGIRTYTAVNGANTARNWALFGFTAFNDGLTFDAQAGKSPGDPTVATGTLGAYVPLHDSGGSFPLDFWFSVTTNRIVGVVKIRNATVTHYASFYLGFVNRFGSPSEWPYPLLISGCTTRVRALFDSTIVTYVSGIVELIAAQANGGPAFYRRADGTWVGINNSRVSNDESSPSRSSETDRILFPSGMIALSSTNPGVDSDDNITDTPTAANGGFSFAGNVGTNILVPTNNLPGVPDKTLHPTPNTGGALRRLFPATSIFALNGPPVEKDIFGEPDGVFWVSAADVTTPLTSEDFIDVGTDRYRVFKSGNRALDYTYFALREK
jgi:hypothetical protein